MMSWHTFDPSTSSTGWHEWQCFVCQTGSGLSFATGLVLDSGSSAIGEWDRVRKELIVDARTITCPHEILYLFVCVVRSVGLGSGSQFRLHCE